MNDNEITVFAETTFRNRGQKFGIKIDDRRRHVYLIGKTGMGKSTVLENMIVDDIRAGKGVAVVDPHGDLAEKIMEYIPEERIRDVVYFNPADMEYPIAFNIVEQVDARVRHLVASGLVGVFKKLWADSWGPRLEYILRNAILAILDYPGSSLLDVIRILSDKPYRKKVVAEVQDPVVKAFWQKEFAGYADKFASEAVSPIQNKVGQFLSSALIRNIVGQAKSSINMREIMDSGKILIMSLSKGKIGEDNSSLLGAMMITKIQLAAMSRVDTPEKERKDFYLYIDEFQNFSTESFANILSEARKYRLNLIMAHQYIEQLDEKVKPAVFGNVGTIVSFRVGAADAEELVKEFTPIFTEEDIVNLPKFEFYLRLMIDGIASDPFSARGLPPLREEEETNNADKAIEFSRQKYAKRREIVEEEIMQSHFREEYTQKQIEKREGVGADKTGYLNRNEAPPGSVEQKAASRQRPVQEEEKKGYSAKCSSCGANTTAPFVPDGVRPVYCRDCLSDLKNKKREVAETGGKINFSNISPSELLKKEGALKIGSEENEKGVSFSSFKDLKAVDFKNPKKEDTSVDSLQPGSGQTGQAASSLRPSSGQAPQAGQVKEETSPDFDLDKNSSSSNSLGEEHDSPPVFMKENEESKDMPKASEKGAKDLVENKDVFFE